MSRVTKAKLVGRVEELNREVNGWRERALAAEAELRRRPPASSSYDPDALPGPQRACYERQTPADS